MKRKNKFYYFEVIATLLVISAVIISFSISMTRFGDIQNEEHRLKLEESLRLAAVSCYANEGKYPQDINYLIDHYGIQIDTSRYSVHYEVFAENLMPEITVVKRK